MACVFAALLNAASLLALDPVVDQDRQVRGKTGGFLVPVVQHRSGTDQQYGPALAVFPMLLDERQGLNGLSQAHIVGQTGTQPPLPEEVQPSVAAFLIWAKASAKALWQRDRLELRPPLQLLEKCVDPAGDRNALEVQRTVCLFRTQGHLDDLAHASLAGGVLSPEVERRLNFCGIHLDPLAPHFDQGNFESGQGFEFLQRDRLVAECYLPVESHNAVQRHTVATGHFGRLYFGAGTQAQLGAPARPPGAGNRTPKPACSREAASASRKRKAWWTSRVHSAGWTVCILCSTGGQRPAA